RRKKHLSASPALTPKALPNAKGSGRGVALKRKGHRKLVRRPLHARVTKRLILGARTGMSWQPETGEFAVLNANTLEAWETLASWWDNTTGEADVFHSLVVSAATGSSATPTPTSSSPARPITMPTKPPWPPSWPSGPA